MCSQMCEYLAVVHVRYGSRLQFIQQRVTEFMHGKGPRLLFPRQLRVSLDAIGSRALVDRIL
jgi:hypothetical protein